MRVRFLVGVFLLLGCGKPPDTSPEVVVAAAASLRGVLPEMASAYEKSHAGQKVTLTFGASGELRQEVVAGAPIDVVVFAGAAPVDDLVERGLVGASSRAVIATNTLVLIGPKGGKKVTFATLALVGADDKVAVGDPRSVPAGQYAKAALEHLHEWDALQGRLVYGNDVSAVLAYATRGEVVAAIVYKTKLHGVSAVELLDTFGEGLSPRPEVVVGLVTGSHVKGAATSFLGYVEGADARAALATYGFGPP